MLHHAFCITEEASQMTQSMSFCVCQSVNGESTSRKLPCYCCVVV